MDPSPLATVALWRELRRRRVVQALIAYGAAVFAVLQGAEPVFGALLLPDFAFRFLVIVLLAGFPVVFGLAWIYELTGDGIRRTPTAGSAEEPAGAPSGRTLRRWLQLATIMLLALGLAAFTAAGLGRIRDPVADADGRVGVAVFPFRTAPGTAPVLGDGAADLLTTALDGTADLRVVDPWTLWRPLRSAPEAPALAPEGEQAERLARAAGAHRYLLGSAVQTGAQVELTLRLYQVGRAEPIATVAVGAPVDSVVRLVRAAAVGVLTRIWGARRPADLPTELDFRATRSPRALKAYLAAKSALRRGQLDSASAAIDRAIALDSSFVLATLEAVTIKSWGFSIRGQPYNGFFRLLARARPFADSVNPRTRLRFEATAASVRTEGAQAWAAARRILDIDPSDFMARASLGYYEMAYGWQFGASPAQGWDRAEAVVRLDSTYVPSLASRAWWALALGDSADRRRQLRRLLAADTTGDIGAGWIAALRASLASDSAFAATLPSLTTRPTPQILTVLRTLRVTRPDRAETLLGVMVAGADPTLARTGRGELARLEIAEGRVALVDSAIGSGAFRAGNLYRTLERMIVVAALNGVGDEDATRHAVTALRASLPPDSALARFRTQPVWLTGWIIAAWSASAGDTALARRWLEVFDTFPAGGSPEHYAEALRADVESRLAARRGDAATALRQARRAFALWSIHTDATFEFMPEPAMRFHLATLLRDAGQPDSARAMFQSLVPPTTWLGFLTARAHYELGELAAARGDRAVARFYYGRALALWQYAGPAGAPWRDRVRGRLARLAATG